MWPIKKKENSASEFTWAVDNELITIQHENKSLRTLVIKENEWAMSNHVYSFSLFVSSKTCYHAEF